MATGCYRCGSPEGDDVRLCPACIQLKLQERSSFNAELVKRGAAPAVSTPVANKPSQLGSESSGKEHPPKPGPTEATAAEPDKCSEALESEITSSPLTLSLILKIAALATVFGVCFYLLCFSPSGPGLLLSPADKVYARCIEAKAKALKNSAHSTAASGAQADPQGLKMLQDISSAFTTSFYDGMCELMRQACEDDPNGMMCQEALTSKF